MATMGLTPGIVTRRSVANLGMFETIVIIVPVPSTGGGGTGGPSYPSAYPSSYPDPSYSSNINIFGDAPTSKYKVTVAIKIGDKWYEETRIVDAEEARVIASLKGITTFDEDGPMVAVDGIQVMNEEEELRIVAEFESLQTETVMTEDVTIEVGPIELV